MTPYLAISTLLIGISLSPPEVPDSWHVGIFARDIESQEVLLDVNGSLPFRPASTIKAVTTLTALDQLGPEFVYHTSILADTASGTLLLAGSGAPLLSAEDVVRTAIETTAALPDGSSWVLYVDLSAISGEQHLPGWDEDDWNRTYCPPVEPLCIGDNVVEAVISAVGDSVRFYTYPPLPTLSVSLNGLSTGSSTSLTAKGGNWDTGEPELVISGTIQSGTVEVLYKPFAGAPEELGRFLSQELNRNGLNVTYMGVFPGDVADGSFSATSVMYSDPLWVILGSMNKWSRNMVAEQVLRTIAAEASGQPGSTRAGCDISGDLLESLSPNEAGWQMADGSGLSRLNLLTPRQLSDVFLWGFSSLEYGHEFMAGFPVNGADGTLSTRMTEIPQGAFRGKTGSLNDTCTIAGILTAASGRKVSIAVFMHIPRGHIWRARAWQDRYIEELYSIL